MNNPNLPTPSVVKNLTISNSKTGTRQKGLDTIFLARPTFLAWLDAAKVGTENLYAK
jgi:hypothetical protein